MHTKQWIVLLAMIPGLATAQNKKKKQKKGQPIDTTLISSIRHHVQYLADDKLEGRRTGTEGERLAIEYIVNQYKQAGIPAYGADYVQPFDINEGKQIGESTALFVNKKSAILQKDFFPLAASKNTHIVGTPAMALSEKGQPWFINLAEELEANKNNPHYDIEQFIQQKVDYAVKKQYTALFLYNTSSLTDNILFNKNTTKRFPLPVIYLTQEGYKSFFTDHAATLNIDLNVVIEERKRKAHNVVAFINNNATNNVVIGAHFDHLGYGEDKNALDTVHAVHNGADDNASGTGALIELAKLLKNSAAKNNNYIVTHFSGEELGLFGSKYWIENNNATINYMINMDMVGRYDTTHKLTIGGYGTSPTWGEVFAQNMSSNLITKFDSTGSGPSDHASFYRAGIPVLFFFTGSHPDYHKSTDDWDKINYQGEKDIVEYIHQLIQATDGKGKLLFTKTAEPQMGKSKFTVSLGVIPDYGYTGTGVKIDGVSQGKLAEKIGLQAGDVLLQLGTYKFVDVNSYMQTLSKFKKGDQTKLIIKRKEEEKEFDIVF